MSNHTKTFIRGLAVFLALTGGIWSIYASITGLGTGDDVIGFIGMILLAQGLYYLSTMDE